MQILTAFLDRILSAFIAGASPATMKAEDLAGLLELNVSKRAESFEARKKLEAEGQELLKKISQLETTATSPPALTAFSKQHRTVKILVDVGSVASTDKIVVDLHLSYRA